MTSKKTFILLFALCFFKASSAKYSDVLTSYKTLGVIATIFALRSVYNIYTLKKNKNKLQKSQTELANPLNILLDQPPAQSQNDNTINQPLTNVNIEQQQIIMNRHCA